MANTPSNQLQAVLPSAIDVYDTWDASHKVSRAVDVLAADNFTHLRRNLQGKVTVDVQSRRESTYTYRWVLKSSIVQLQESII